MSQQQNGQLEPIAQTGGDAHAVNGKEKQKAVSAPEKSEINDDSGPPSPLLKANPLSVLTYWWANSLLFIGWKKTLTMKQIWELVPKESTVLNGALLEKHLYDENGHRRGILRTIMTAYWRRYIWASITYFFWTAALFTNSYYILRELITFAQELAINPKRSRTKGYLYAMALALLNLTATLFVNITFFFAIRVGLQIKSGLNDLIYRKAIRLATLKSIGNVVNLISNDSQRIPELFLWFNFLWGAPAQFIAVSVLLIITLGWPAVCGMVVIAFFFGLQIFLGRMSQKLRRAAVAVTDRRVRAMSEILTSVKMLKFYNWEESFAKKVAKIRDEEMVSLRRVNVIKAMNFACSLASPLIAGLVVYTIYILTGRVLTGKKTFLLISLMNQLRFPLFAMPMAVKALTDSWEAFRRIDTFLGSAEVPPMGDRDQQSVPDGHSTITIKDGTFQYPDTESPQLRQVNLDIKKGQLIAVCGAVGAGKTTLLSAILNQIPTLSGQVETHGRVALVAQQPWILNMSLKNNIIFGSVFEEERYQRTLEACSLLPDLAILPAGDATEIGERGINLSGGQKARVSLARAVYNSADIYLLDDPLSAVDQHVSKAIFHNCVKGALRGRTVIMVTHQLQYLSQCDAVVLIDNGKVLAFGAFSKLMEETSFRELIEEHVGVEDAPDEKKKDTAKDEKMKTDAPKAKAGGGGGAGKLVMKEESGSGGISWRVIRAYVLAMGGFFVVTFCLLLFILTQGGMTVSTWFLSKWNRDSFNHNEKWYLKIYAALIGATVALAIVRGLLFAYLTIRGSTRLHDSIFAKVLTAPMYFFDATPVGRILNRFSKDQEIMDEMLPDAMLNALQYTLNVLGALILISAVLPFFSLAVIPVAAMYIFLSYFYRFSSREIKRLEGVTRSPIIAHLSATLQGLQSIRAFGVGDKFIADNQRNTDVNTRCWFAFQMLARWLAIRLDASAAIIVGIVAFYCVGAKFDDPSKVGLLLTNAISITGIFQWMMRSIAESEAFMTAVERQTFYQYNLPAEPPRHVKDHTPPKEWPQQGAVAFKNLTMRYRADLPPVLTDVSFDVKPREKVGIVGRTGAGKSTVALSLWHMIHRESGSIEIDGVDIFKIGISDLRQKISIIPQDPVMFVGTLRYNLDPFDSHENDADIWEALQRVNLKDWVSEQPLKLQTPIVENGENLSVGQRQLVCIARALLRKSKILFLDEATAAVDMETDAMIQKTLRTAFSDCTLLTIAHRLNTIIDYDKVLVLSDGRAVEFDSPAELLARPKSAFYALVNETGKQMAKNLTDKALSRALLSPREVPAVETVAASSTKEPIALLPSSPSITRPASPDTDVEKKEKKKHKHRHQKGDDKEETESFLEKRKRRRRKQKQEPHDPAI